jgi:hypothetical protein
VAFSGGVRPEKTPSVDLSAVGSLTDSKRGVEGGSALPACGGATPSGGLFAELSSLGGVPDPAAALLCFASGAGVAVSAI